MVAPYDCVAGDVYHDPGEIVKTHSQQGLLHMPMLFTRADETKRTDTVHPLPTSSARVYRDAHRHNAKDDQSEVVLYSWQVAEEEAAAHK